MKKDVTHVNINDCIFSGIKVERLEPHSSNLVCLHMNVTVQGEQLHKKKNTMTIFQLKNAFRYVLCVNNITLFDDFISAFPTLHFYATFDKSGRIKKAIPVDYLLISDIEK